MLSVLQPPPTAEELALKDQVTQMLTSQGVLAKLKAELRAAVFEVMHEREGFVKANDPKAPKLSDFSVETRTTALSLIVECLHFFHWEHALRVLLAETNAENEQNDSALLAKKLGLASNSSKPTLFQLIEFKVDGGEQAAVSARVMAPMKYDRYDREEKEHEVVPPSDISVPKAKPWGQEEGVQQLPSKEADTAKLVTKDVAKDNDEAEDEGSESNAEIEESVAEEVPSGSELEESNYTNHEDEESQSAVFTKQPATLDAKRVQEESEDDEKAPTDVHEKDKHESDGEDAVALAAPPPAPAKLPALPPLVGSQSNTPAGDAEDDFDAEDEVERLRKLDAALQAMEAEDDTGTLQKLKASLQMELQEQDSFVSSGGLGKAEEDSDEEAETSKRGKDEEEGEYGYGSSDFEEEEIASEVSEEMESMPELSDKEDESEDGADTSAAEMGPPRVLQNDTRVDSEDALNSYDYIEDVEKGGW